MIISRESVATMVPVLPLRFSWALDVNRDSPVRKKVIRSFWTLSLRNRSDNATSCTPLLTSLTVISNHTSNPATRIKVLRNISSTNHMIFLSWYPNDIVMRKYDVMPYARHIAHSDTLKWLCWHTATKLICFLSRWWTSSSCTICFILEHGSEQIRWNH